MITAGRTGGIKNASAAYAPPYAQLKNGVVLGTTGDPNATRCQEKRVLVGLTWGAIFGDGHFRGLFSGLVFGMSFSGEIRGPDSGDIWFKVVLGANSGLCILWSTQTQGAPWPEVGLRKISVPS